MIQSVFKEYLEFFEFKSELVKNIYFKCTIMKLFMFYLNVLQRVPNHCASEAILVHNYYNELGLVGCP